MRLEEGDWYMCRPGGGKTVWEKGGKTDKNV